LRGTEQPITAKRTFAASASFERIAKAKAGGVYKGRRAAVDAAQVRAMKAQGLEASEIAKALKIGRAGVGSAEVAAAFDDRSSQQSGCLLGQPAGSHPEVPRFAIRVPLGSAGLASGRANGACWASSDVNDATFCSASGERGRRATDLSNEIV
jgi:hypothetical protein